MVTNGPPEVDDAGFWTFVALCPVPITAHAFLYQKSPIESMVLNKGGKAGSRKEPRDCLNWWNGGGVGRTRREINNAALSVVF